MLRRRSSDSCTRRAELAIPGREMAQRRHRVAVELGDRRAPGVRLAELASPSGAVVSAYASSSIDSTMRSVDPHALARGEMRLAALEVGARESRSGSRPRTGTARSRRRMPETNLWRLPRCTDAAVGRVADGRRATSGRAA